MLSDSTRFKIGIGLVTLPVFVVGFLLGAAVIIAIMTQSANAATQGKAGKTSTAVLEIRLQIQEQTQNQGASKHDNKVHSQQLQSQVVRESILDIPTITVIRDGKKYFEPV